jgi:hypothetical protein
VDGSYPSLCTSLAESREYVNGAGLDYPWTTVTHHWSRGAPSAIERPWSDALEQLTAWYVVDCASRERASELARGLLELHVTAVEVRRIHTLRAATRTQRLSG